MPSAAAPRLPAASRSARELVRTGLVGPAVLLAGAAGYSLAEGPAHMTFFATPLVVGLVAVAAGLLGRDQRLVPAGIGLVGWGGAVILVYLGVVPAPRTAPADMFGVAAGVLAAGHLAPTGLRGSWSRSAAVTVLVGALGFYLAFGHPALGRWPVWALSMLAWAAWVALSRLPGSPLRRPVVADTASAP